MAFFLHPLVILNITDHSVRNRVQKGGPRVIGAVLGSQTGRNVEIHTSFELLFDVIDGVPVIDTKYLNTKKEQFSKVFPNYEILGWYTTGSGLDKNDITVHKAFMTYNESPLLVLVDTQPPTTVRDLPVTIYESLFVLENGQQIIKLNKVAYRIESEESERISVDHVTHLGVTGASDTNSIIKAVTSQRDAANMLHMRIKLIITYLERVQRGEHPVDHNMLRNIASLCHKLPAMDSAPFTAAFQNEYHDTLLISYLGFLTKACNTLNELTEKSTFAFDRSRGGRRPFF
eukprot:TRINITY_DN100687_c0_g1_i1.p1 TRINITY_DN100687_c0_g1~~TRINITY_DN100687_c0_g1_i1.p1  ORF type:complete len:295 (-),score=50.98 TRINITY_DN100687_c0_g1_i1:15-878(-)